MAFRFRAKEKIIKYRNKNKRTIHHKKLCYETEGNCFLNVLILNREPLLDTAKYGSDDRIIIEKMLPRKNCDFSQMKIEIKSFCSTRHTPASSHAIDEEPP